MRATCVDGRSHRFKMTVAEECVFDRHRTPHAMSLFDMHQKYADVLGVDAIVRHLESLSAQSAFVSFVGSWTLAKSEGPTSNIRRNRIFEVPELTTVFSDFERTLASPAGDAQIAAPARPAVPRKRACK